VRAHDTRRSQVAALDFGMARPSLLEPAPRLSTARTVARAALGALNGVSAFGLDTDARRFARLFFQPALVAWALASTGAGAWLADQESSGAHPDPEAPSGRLSGGDSRDRGARVPDARS
jgi:hypothetical protein